MPTAELSGIGYPVGATAEHRPTGHPTGLTHARGDAMFRHQFHAQVKLGKFRDFYATFEKFDGAVRARSLAPPQLWAQSFGKETAS